MLKIRTVQDRQAEGFAKLILTRAPHLKCQGCGNAEFAVLEQPEAKLRTWLVRQLQPQAQVGFVASQPLVTLICTNCGLLVQFAEAALQGANPALYGDLVTS